MKFKLQLLVLITVCLLALTMSGCKKDVLVDNNDKLAPPVSLPVISTGSVSNISAATAVSGGIASADTGIAITARGVCWGPDSIPVITGQHTSDSTGKGSFTSTLTGLTQGTIYYVRAYATTAAGTAYGKAMRFSTGALDADGNLYHTVIIGTQMWMLENLQTTHYRNGDPITKVTDDASWVSLMSSTGAYCTYNYTESNAPIYGRLYNYMAIYDPRNVCPAGWHLPTNNDWQTLTLLLGGIEVAGGAMKESGAAHWKSPNTGATNSSGFTALAAGNCGYGGFASLGDATYFWSDPTEQYTRALLSDHADIAGTGNTYSVLGLSIRCIRD